MKSKERMGLSHNVITREEMFGPILGICPGFQGEWDQFVAEWKDTPEGPQYYLALSDLARYVIGLLERGESEVLAEVFRVVEDWHLQGDAFVREAATVGFIEDLQNGNLHKAQTKPDDFLPYLLAETRFWWFKVADFWERGNLIVDDRPRH